jgi:hypothetical protein
MGWNRVRWWLEWISTVGQGEGVSRNAGWVSSKKC